MVAMSEAKGPIEQVVELAVYAPIGLVLEAKRLLPTLVAKGRQQVEMARVVGQFAVQQGQSQASQRLGKAQGQAGSILSDLGLTSAPAQVASPPLVPDPDAPVPRPAVATVRSSAASGDLPIADYDGLAASQVIPRLSGLAPEELAEVRTYELGHRGRKTILGKINQLSGE